MRALVSMLSLILVLVVALPSGAAADTLISQERAPSKVSEELTGVAWSSYGPATGDYSLNACTVAHSDPLTFVP